MFLAAADDIFCDPNVKNHTFFCMWFLLYNFKYSIWRHLRRCNNLPLVCFLM